MVHRGYLSALRAWQPPVSGPVPWTAPSRARCLRRRWRQADIYGRKRARDARPT